MSKEVNPKSQVELIAVPADGQLVAPHFARAPLFVLAEVAAGQVGTVTLLPNPSRPEGGLVRWLADQGATGVLAGDMGHRSRDRCAEIGLWVLTGHEGPIEQVLQGFADQQRPDETAEG